MQSVLSPVLRLPLFPILSVSYTFCYSLFYFPFFVFPCGLHFRFPLVMYSLLSIRCLLPFIGVGFVHVSLALRGGQKSLTARDIVPRLVIFVLETGRKGRARNIISIAVSSCKL
ncbi:hypothetical protein DM02DRAFT_678736 [Periconia macrospinosa]|uniref:Uncharacterized protein n=1 Tax=Periconia macrospinosa TaxID=97972 RepID=A0A2V1CYH2_9PLEO|nr:hypothetical protein DM02DRAFT_678736 [Periconia macrospinosa]